MFDWPARTNTLTVFLEGILESTRKMEPMRRSRSDKTGCVVIVISNLY
jgi:hypothetical protein